MTRVFVLIIGTKDTPFEGGFYFFQLSIPDNYPIKPPKMHFLTLSPDIRIHPNLYTEGKVCLSIINTWEGDGWSASNTLRSMLIAVQSYVFNEYPLHNEPGFESEAPEKGSSVLAFNRFVTFQNYRIAINKMLTHVPHKALKPLVPVMEKHIRANAQSYFNRLIELCKTRQSEEVVCTAYSGKSSCITDYHTQYERFAKYCASLGITPETPYKPDKKSKPKKSSPPPAETAPAMLLPMKMPTVLMKEQLKTMGKLKTKKTAKKTAKKVKD